MLGASEKSVPHLGGEKLKQENKRIQQQTGAEARFFDKGQSQAQSFLGGRYFAVILRIVRHCAG